MNAICATCEFEGRWRSNDWDQAQFGNVAKDRSTVTWRSTGAECPKVVGRFVMFLSVCSTGTCDTVDFTSCVLCSMTIFDKVKSVDSPSREKKFLSCFIELMDESGFFLSLCFCSHRSLETSGSVSVSGFAIFARVQYSLSSKSWDESDGLPGKLSRVSCRLILMSMAAVCSFRFWRWPSLQGRQTARILLLVWQMCS